MYCENCARIVEKDRCPFCGNRKLRNPEAKDPCFLTEQDFVSSGILEDVLRQNGIPFLKKNVMGDGLSVYVGPMLDRSRFYVLYERLPEAESVVNDLFAPAEEDGAPDPDSADLPFPGEDEGAEES